MSDETPIDFSSVLASAVHDMKNSLCMLIQSIDQLSQSSSHQSKEQAEELARLHYEASRLNTNLMQLLSLYRAEKHQLPMTIEEHYIDDLIEEMIAKNEIYIEKRGLTIEIDNDEALAWYLDMDLVGNMLNDILINAMRYSKDTIVISTEIINDELHIHIQDNGDGYPQEMIDLIDLPMQDLNFDTGRTGLGLFFARMIAKAHKNQNKEGRIMLENGGKLGGSVFTLILP
nr:HAMP domain-containing sensor histidine kinase [Catenovulum sediminis]